MAYPSGPGGYSFPVFVLDKTPVAQNALEVESHRTGAGVEGYVRGPENLIAGLEYHTWFFGTWGRRGGTFCPKLFRSRNGAFGVVLLYLRLGLFGHEGMRIYRTIAT